MLLEAVIGDYQTFYTELLQNLREKQVNVETFPLSHLCFRVETLQEYDNMGELLKQFSKAVSTHVHHDRPFSIYLLKEDIIFSKTHQVSLIELPSPKITHPYPTGLEHIGFVVGDEFSDFKKQYNSVLSREKDRIVFPNGHTAKFYSLSLQKTLADEGNTFQLL